MEHLIFDHQQAAAFGILVSLDQAQGSKGSMVFESSWFQFHDVTSLRIEGHRCRSDRQCCDDRESSCQGDCNITFSASAGRVKLA